MKTPLLLVILGLTLVTSLASAATYTWTTTQSFVDYMERGANAYLNDSSTQVAIQDYGVHGTGVDRRYFPYETSQGWRIGFGLPVASDADYSVGITQTDADTRLRTAITAAVSALTAYLPPNYGHNLNELPQTQQEILVDYAVTDGVDKIPSQLVQSLYDTAGDPTLAAMQLALADVHNCSYVRKAGPLLAVLKNRAFAYRYLGSQHH